MNQLTLPDPGTVAPVESELLLIDFYWVVIEEGHRRRFESWEQAREHQGWNATLAYIEEFEDGQSQGND